MTRGFFVKTASKKIIKAGYSNSDSYEEYCGLQFLNSIIDSKEETFIDTLEPCEDFTMDLITKGEELSPGNYFKFDYGYVYNKNTGTLKVYHFCVPIYTIKTNDPSEIEKYRYLFENTEAVKSVGLYNAAKYDYIYDRNYAVYKKIVKESSLEDLKKYSERFKEERIVLDDSHCVMNGHRSDHQVYQKRLSSNVRDSFLDFIAENDSFMGRSYGWQILIQSPFVRVPVSISFTSEKAAVNHIRELIDYKADLLFRLGDIFHKISDAIVLKDKAVLANLVNGGLESLWQEEPWFIYNGYFTAKWLKKECADRLARLEKTA